jgi:glycosyltransferase involved in cell wall biosynthesis
MRILLVHNAYKIPGGEEVVVEQERKLLEQAGHEVFFYGRTNFEADEYHGVRQLALIRNIAWSDGTSRELGEILHRRQPDIVHVHNTFMMMSPIVYTTCRTAGIPVVQTLHNYRMFCPGANFVRGGKACEECTEHGLLRGVRYGCYRDSKAATASVALMIAHQRKRQAYPDAFIALSEFSRQKFLSHGVPAQKLFVKPNFVAPDPGERIETGSFAVVVGRLSSEKGLPVLLAGWKHLQSRVPLKIVGDGPLLSETQQKAQQMGLAELSFTGRLPRPQAQALMKAARFLVATSECYENFPMGIAEAFAAGVPVICSRLGAMQEIVDHEFTGLHFNPGDPADLAEKVTWAWNHPVEMNRMGREARRQYEARYTPEKNYPILMSIYQQVMAANTTAVEASAVT